MKEILIFKPIYKTVLWGGSRIAALKGDGSVPAGKIGESWELSAVEGYESTVAQGEYKGLTLSELTKELGVSLVGRNSINCFGNEFPILIKIIDAAADLSVQVHPDDVLAAQRGIGRGKIEMWYSLHAEPQAYLYSGFTKPVSREEFCRRAADGSIMDVLRKYHPRRGDVFFLPSGRIHSIGAGNMVVEIQESSDATYRIYDYNRIDTDGLPRRLHIDESLDAVLHADVTPESVPNAQPRTAESQILAQCSLFTVELTGVRGSHTVDLSRRDSFTAVVVTEGTLRFYAGANTVELGTGFSALIPAGAETLTVSGEGAFLQTFI